MKPQTHSAAKNGAVILAAGEGKRMHSDLPKVLCPVCGRPMLDYVVEACGAAAGDVCVVVGFRGDAVIEHLGGRAETVWQREQLGTAHAVRMAEDFIRARAERGGHILVACGDAPLMDAATLSDALKAHETAENAVTVITAELDDPAAYGRIIKRDGRFLGIVEYKDCSEEEKRIREINSGAYWFRAADLLRLLPRVQNHNAQKEYYLTDTVALALSDGLRAGTYTAASPDVVMGANTPEQLKELETQLAKRAGSLGR